MAIAKFVSRYLDLYIPSYQVYRERVVKGGGSLKVVILQCFGFCREHVIEVMRIENVQSLLDVNTAAIYIHIYIYIYYICMYIS